jgi:hypothetical protein
MQGLSAHPFETDYHEIKAVARNEGVFLPYCIGKRERGSMLQNDIILTETIKINRKS